MTTLLTAITDVPLDGENYVTVSSLSDFARRSSFLPAAVRRSLTVPFPGAAKW